MGTQLTSVIAAMCLIGCGAVTSQPVPSGVPDQVTVSGFTCQNGYGESLNQVYAYQGNTLDGRPYYRGTDETDRYIYFDRRCADDTPYPRWILGGEPDVTRTSDLNQGDSPGCENDLGLASEAMLVPTGTQPADWLWCGDHGDPSGVG